MPVQSRFARRVVGCLVAVAAMAAVPLFSRGAEPIKFEQETLSNGLRVIYAPMDDSPVVHIRVLYHVGSRDEKADHQGFAHMFEHMMFRGSAHVAPQEHMKVINSVGGYSNAFTSFDETVYVNTVPAAYLETGLYLEADRMSSFKVSPAIFATERNVVAQEWALRHNLPYGEVFEELLKTMFTTHSYHWTPIGNMDHLKAATSVDLQEFFNKYYVPNNAVLVLAGKLDVPATKEMVKKYYGWIPGQSEERMAATRGYLSVLTVPKPVERNIPAEPEQKEARRIELKLKVPSARVMIGYPMPPLASEDQDAIGVMAAILGEGRSSRLSRLLVTSENQLCSSAEALSMSLEDGGTLGASASVLDGKSPDEVEKRLKAAIAEIRDKGVTADEIAKARQQARLFLAARRETAESIATELGEEALFHNDPGRVNTAEARLDAITPEKVQAVAKKYFVDTRATTLIVRPDPDAAPASRPAPVAAAKDDVTPEHVVKFPAGYPEHAPLPTTAMKATFAKGTEKQIAGLTVIVMPDRRIPLVNWSLTMRAGSLAEPADKTGLAAITAAMVRRGPAGTTYNAFNEDLESRAISLEVADGGDTTRLGGSCLVEQLPYAMTQTRKLLLEPAFSVDEFARLKKQNLSGIKDALTNPTGVAARELSRLVYGDTPLGRSTSIESINAITLDDVKSYYGQTYRPNDAILVISGDLSVEDGQKLAETLLAGWKQADLPKAAYALPEIPKARRILLVDRPESKQTNVRMAIRAFSIKSDDKFAATLASQILSYGIDSRLGRYVRAEKGLTYNVQGMFVPTRQDGLFSVSTDTRIETSRDIVEAVFTVLDRMKKENVTDQELTEAKLRVAGSMLMATQTITAQAARRLDVILNGYPIDYFDTYAERISKVTADEIRAVMNKYVDDSRMSLVLVAPAAAAKEQLTPLGTVNVVAMPLERKKN
jgi:zinc protease